MSWTRRASGTSSSGRWCPSPKTVRSATLERKHRIGTIILRIYSTVGAHLRGTVTAGYEHFAPYYEQMKRVFLRLRGKRKPKKTSGDEEE